MGEDRSPQPTSSVRSDRDDAPTIVSITETTTEVKSASERKQPQKKAQLAKEKPKNTKPKRKCPNAKCVMAVLLALACVLAATLGIMMMMKETPKPKVVCDTVDCFKAAYSIKASVNPSISPCEDFYSYACGGHVVSQLPKRTVDKLEKYKAALLIRPSNTSCPNNVTSRAVRLLSLAYEKCLATNHSIEEVVAHARSIHRNGFVDLEVALGRVIKNGASFFADVQLTSAGLNEPVMFTVRSHKLDGATNEMLRNDRFRDKYYNLLLQEINKHDAKKVFDFMALLRDSERHEAAPRLAKVEDLQMRIPKVNWVQLLNAASSENGKTVTENTPIRLFVSDEWFTKMNTVLDMTSNETIANHALWRYAMAYRSAVRGGGDFIAESQPDAASECLQPLLANMKWAVERINAEQFDGQYLKGARRMVSNIHGHLQMFLDAQSNLTVIHAKNVAKNLTIVVGYPERFENLTAVDKYLEKLNFTESDSYMKVLDAIFEWKHEQQLEKHKRRKIEEVAEDIEVDGAQLQEWYLGPSVPAWHSYGHLGSRIAAQMIALVTVTGDHNCSSTDFTESGAAHFAFEAYSYRLRQQLHEKNMPGLSNFTNQQLFFISQAQEFCPAHLSNPSSGLIPGSPSVAVAFNCSSTSHLSLLRKCDIWQDQPISSAPALAFLAVSAILFIANL